jgi:hypothetical protein
VRRSAGLLNAPMDDEGGVEIARRSRGTPRIANRLLRRVRDYADVKGTGRITLDIANKALAMLDVDPQGFDVMDRKLLEAVIHRFDGGPVGLDNIAASIGEERDTIEDVIEPYLIQQGYLQRTPRGRIATLAAYRHLGVAPPSNRHRAVRKPESRTPWLLRSPAYRWMVAGRGPAGAGIVVPPGWRCAGRRSTWCRCVQAPLVRTLQFSARVATLSRVDVGCHHHRPGGQVLVAEGAQVRRAMCWCSWSLRTARRAGAGRGRRAAGRRAPGRAAQHRAARRRRGAGAGRRHGALRRRPNCAGAATGGAGFLSASRLDDARRAVDVAQAQRDSARAQAQANRRCRHRCVQAQAQLALAAGGHAVGACAAGAGAGARAGRRPGAGAPGGARADRAARQAPAEPGAGKGPPSWRPRWTSASWTSCSPARRPPRGGRRLCRPALCGPRLSIAPAVDAQRGAIEVKFALPQPPPAYLREDMTLSVEVETARRERALVLPLAALAPPVRPAGGGAVLVVRRRPGGRRRRCTLGLRTLDGAEVLQGLAEGDAVVCWLARTASACAPGGAVAARRRRPGAPRPTPARR